MLGVIFYSGSFRLFNLAFLTEFFILSERYCCPGLKFKKKFTCDDFFSKFTGFKKC